MIRQKLNLSKTINASREKVWKVLLGNESYPIWASVFMEGSHVETDWKEGSKALFLGQDGTGMVSRIKQHTPNERITIEHLGVVSEGNKEDYESEEARKWKDTEESYRVESRNGKTELFIEQDIADEYAEYFEATWKKALEKVKQLAEKE